MKTALICIFLSLSSFSAMARNVVCSASNGVEIVNAAVPSTGVLTVSEIKIPLQSTVDNRNYYLSFNLNVGAIGGSRANHCLYEVWPQLLLEDGSTQSGRIPISARGYCFEPTIVSEEFDLICQLK